MLKSVVYSSFLIAAIGLFAGGCAATPDDETDDPSNVVAPATSLDLQRSPSSVTLLANLGSAQGATAAASNGTTAVRWPSSALKGTYNVTNGQPCSTVAAPSGTVLTKSISLSTIFANCN